MIMLKYESFYPSLEMQVNSIGYTLEDMAEDLENERMELERKVQAREITLLERDLEFKEMDKKINKNIKLMKGILR